MDTTWNIAVKITLTQETRQAVRWAPPEAVWPAGQGESMFPFV